MKTTNNIAILLAAATGAAASAEVLDGLSANAFSLSTPPVNVIEGMLEDSSNVHVFVESSSTLSGDLSVDHIGAGLIDEIADAMTGMIPNGTRVTSAYIHWDPVGNSETSVTATVTFSQPILGVIFDEVTLDFTDAQFGAAGTTYPMGGGFDVELTGDDSFEISADARTIELNFTASASSDDMRVILANPIKGLVHEYNFEGNGIDCVSGADAVFGENTEYYDHNDSVPFALGRAVRVGGNAGILQGGLITQAEFFEIGTSDFTFAFSFNREQLDTSDADFIFDAGDTAGYDLHFRSGARVGFFDLADGSDYTTNNLGISSMETDWHHLAFVCDRSEMDGARWYLNGQLIHSEDATGIVSLIHDIDPLIGKSSDGVATKSLDGRLGRFQVYNYALSQSQVEALAEEAGAVPICVGDLNGDGSVGSSDLAEMLGRWGACP